MREIITSNGVRVVLCNEINTALFERAMKGLYLKAQARKQKEAKNAA